MTPEGAVKKAICDYLAIRPGCLFWYNFSTGIFDPVKKRYIKPNSRYVRNGVADILGIYKGKPLAIEVKSATGTLSEPQKRFLADFAKAGGIAIMARSIDDVARALNAYDPKE